MVEVDLLAALVAGLPATVVMTVMMSATKAAWPTHGALPRRMVRVPSRAPRSHGYPADGALPGLMPERRDERLELTASPLPCGSG